MATDTLRIDLETYSRTSLKTAGVYKYVADPSFEILLFAYAYNNDPVQIVDLAQGERLPDEVLEDLTNHHVTKTAFNAVFEIACLTKEYDLKLDPNQWECTMVLAGNAGLPLKLATVGEVLQLPEQKMAEGQALIKYFCEPCKPTKTNGNRTRNLPHHDPDKWALFCKYCMRDVTVERKIAKVVPRINTDLPLEKKLWALDQKINRRGVKVDLQLIECAISIADICKKDLLEQAKVLTGLANPNSRDQLKAWLETETGEDIDKMDKEAIKDLKALDISRLATDVLTLRQEMNKSSVTKYKAMLAGVGVDRRIRGLLQFYGAMRTGRWAGRLVQIHNLPRNYLEDLDLAREMVLADDAQLIDMCYPNIPDVLSQLIRTAFIPADGCTFLVADFSAIEARVIAWLADEKWRLDVFNTHGRIYEASAAAMFKVNIDLIKKGNEEYKLRSKGKIAELALGYQGSSGALIAMGALKMGLEEAELPALVKAWRRANPSIVKFWYDTEAAAVKALKTGTTVPHRHGVSYTGGKGVLYANLPSGRRLTYHNARLVENRFGREAIQYEGMNDKNKWAKLDTYGGKLVENLTQAVARDLLAESMLALDAEGFPIVMHIHDEAVIEAPKNDPYLTLENACSIMGRPIRWAPGLPLNAEGFETPYYKKEG